MSALSSLTFTTVPRIGANPTLDPSRIVLLGFSQGGCLALEFAARNAGRYGAVIGLSAGLIGPDGTSRAYAGLI
jgi:predicted esterase